MNSPSKGSALWLRLLLPIFLAGSISGQVCINKFKKGREDFVLDTDESVKDGAVFLSSPELSQASECVAACCENSRCNVAFMERVGEEGSIKSCFLFDCLYKKKYACRFVRKKGYLNYIVASIYESYLELDGLPKETDRPPVANGGQDRVVQPQDSVTLNGIESKDDNGIVSYEWQQTFGENNAIIEKTSNADQIIVSNLSSGIYKFQLTVSDTIGQSDSTKITILVLTPEQSEHHCMAPKKVGPCRGSFPRWHYNAASEQCEMFLYGGCRSNLNNYLSIDECTKACWGSDKRGTGRGLPIPPSPEKCGTPCSMDQFTCDNGCCLDPGLECDLVKQCSDGSDELKCTDLGNTFTNLLNLPVDERKVRCTEPPDTGRCRDSLTMWYYNPLQEDCLRFNYGGCLGNDNNFGNKDTCLKACKGVTEKDVFQRKEFERQVSENKTVPIAVAAVLGIAIAIILGILLYCFLKGKRKPSQHHRVPVNNVPVTTFEDRERLVYNSTTKPI